MAPCRVPELCSEYGNRMAACGAEGLSPLALLFPAEPTPVCGAVDENSTSAAPVGLASSVLSVHGVDKRVKAA